MNVAVVYGDFDCLLCYLASQRADQLAGTGAARIEWRAVERGAVPARWEQEVTQAKALTLPGERLPAAPPPAPESREITGTPTTMLMMAVATPPPTVGPAGTPRDTRRTGSAAVLPR